MWLKDITACVIIWVIYLLLSLHNNYKLIFNPSVFFRGPLHAPNAKQRSFGLYTLIVDDMGAQILDQCMKMTELGQRRIAVVEKLELKRKPMPNYEGIYVIKPDEDSVNINYSIERSLTFIYVCQS